MNQNIKETREKRFRDNKNFFKNEDKIAAFDEIATLFFDSNFGSTSKSDIELLMFHLFLTQYNKRYTLENGNLSYPECNDFMIAKQLAITPQKVRNMKVKQQLVYPAPLDWKAAFEALIRKAHYDKETRKITISIPDPNVYSEVQNYLETMDGVVEKTLNSKNLVISPQYFLQLAISVSSEPEKKKLIKELKKIYNQQCKDDAQFDSFNIGKTLSHVSGVLDITTAIVNLAGITANPWLTALATVIKTAGTILDE